METNDRIERMMRELQSEPVTGWFCGLFSLMEPGQMADEYEVAAVPSLQAVQAL